MSRKAKWILLILIVLITLAMIWLAAGSYFHKPTVNQVDTLQTYIEQRKASAESYHDSAETEKQKSDEILNSPIDSALREDLWSRIVRDVKADSARKRTP